MRGLVTWHQPSTSSAILQSNWKPRKSNTTIFSVHCERPANLSGQFGQLVNFQYALRVSPVVVFHIVEDKRGQGGTESI